MRGSKTPRRQALPARLDAYRPFGTSAQATLRLASSPRFCWIAGQGGFRRTRVSRGQLAASSGACFATLEARMVPFFVQIKCHLGKSYEVASKLADAEIASEIYSTAGEFDLLAKFYVEAGTDIGHFVNQQVQTIPGIQDTRTIITFKAF
jgi:DNA-binding Lrp family transcriptional regulator